MSNRLPARALKEDGWGMGCWRRFTPWQGRFSGGGIWIRGIAWLRDGLNNGIYGGEPGSEIPSWHHERWKWRQWGRLVLSYQLDRKLSRLKDDQPLFRGFCYGYPNHRAPRRRGLFSQHTPPSLASSLQRSVTTSLSLLPYLCRGFIRGAAAPPTPPTRAGRGETDGRLADTIVASQIDDLIRAERTRWRAEDYHCTRAVRLQYDSSTTPEL
jgi:hypothetical protein